MIDKTAPLKVTSSSNAGPARVERIRAALRGALEPTALEIEDESHLHAGHAGARDGRGHFSVQVVSPQFAGLRSLARHQLIYRSLADLMQTDIHALRITALTPDEVPAGTTGHSQKS